MRRLFRLFTILITSFVMALSGLAASSVASASENQTVRVSATFSPGSSVLTKARKAAIKKAVATSGTDAAFIVTAAGGKVPGVSDTAVKLLAKKRGQAVKAYLVKLGVSKSNVKVKVKITRLGIVPKTKIVGTYTAPTATTTPTTTTITPTNTSTPTTTISVAAIAGVTAPVAGATPVTTTTAGTGYTGAVTWSGSPSTFALATPYTATITLTPTSGYTLTGVTANFFTVAGATPVTNSVNTGVITAMFPATATTYAVGNTGPGGGIIYYVSAANFTSTGSTCNTACKYLEVAPATWQSAGASVANDGTYVWSTNNTVLTTQDSSIASSTESGFAGEQVNWQIGEGFNNTKVMEVAGATSSAQAAVLAYAGNATAGEWFIPSMNELNELCKYARGQTTGVLTVACDNTGSINGGTGALGFVGNGYWSSSEGNASSASNQAFQTGALGGGGKTNSVLVRPIRAF